MYAGGTPVTRIFSASIRAAKLPSTLAPVPETDRPPTCFAHRLLHAILLMVVGQDGESDPTVIDGDSILADKLGTNLASKSPREVGQRVPWDAVSARSAAILQLGGILI